MNKVLLIGRLVKDGELRYIPSSGTPVINFKLAVNRPFKQADGATKADFIPIILFGKLAEVLSAYLIKGKQVAVFGRLQTRSFDDKDGKKQYVTEVVTNEVQLLSKNESGNINNNNSNSFNRGFNPDMTPIQDDGDIPF